MATLQADDVLDLIRGSQKEQGKLRFTDIATELTRHECMSQIMRKNRMQLDGGTGIQRNLMYSDSGAAREVGLHQVDDINIQDSLVQLSIPWRHYETHWAWDRREFLMNNGGGGKIYDLVKARRIGGMLSLAKLMEQRFWSKPATSSDALKVFGVFYWLVYNATEGHNGGAATGFSAGPGNVNPTTYARWKNYTAQYANVSKDDLIKKMRRAWHEIDFESPVDIPDYRRGRGDQMRIYCTLDTKLAVEELAEAQNENLGRDLYPYDGGITFKGSPIRHVPAFKSSFGLIASGSEPVLMLNWANFYPVFLRGNYLAETGPDRLIGSMHNEIASWLDCTSNTLCTDRRRQALIAKSDPMA